MKYELLPLISSPAELKSLSDEQLLQVADEIREALCDIVSDRPAHFASNLGVVELCLALHTVFDFSKDRLIWDTGHQIYPHKLVTGRYDRFATIRTKGGLMGYPNPHESPYDLFMTGHAGWRFVVGPRRSPSGRRDRGRRASVGDRVRSVQPRG
jgi:1-deoxy-D-xylulose-5-phosphate synthase